LPRPGDLSLANRLRLDDARLFFKNQGSYIINNMMGYLSLTVIIDRIICAPMYGASNFGDIRDLMAKMLEVCTYEKILLAKTASLVSADVYSKLLAYKKLSCKSFSAQDNYCHVCSKQLQPNPDTFSIVSNMSICEQPLPLLDTSRGSEASANTSFEARQTEAISDNCVVIFHCGHAFHENCFELNHGKSGSCPVCKLHVSSSSSSNTFRRGCLPKSTSSPKRVSMQRLVEGASSSRPEALSDERAMPSYFNKSIVFSDRQQMALRSIRSRNTKEIDVWSKYGVGGGSVHAPQLEIEKRSKLRLAPANLSKFIN